MKIYLHGDKIEYSSAAIALGNFDGMHLGHIRILENARNEGEHFGALLFEKHTSEETVITPLWEKLDILSELGADYVYIVKFDDDFKNMSLADFVRFLKKIGVCVVSAGYDYRCAKNASANVFELSLEAEKSGIKTVITSAVCFNGIPVKSSDIRILINKGMIKEANALLSRPFTLSGCVVSGFQNGRKMGFPTANINVSDEALLPCDGVYVGGCYIDSGWYKAVINVGANPTLGAKKRTVEGHIIGINKDLYGRKISFRFFERIRGEMKFSGLEELKKQIEKDRQYALKCDCTF